MKNLLIVFVLILSFTGASLAQAVETFDIATFTSPKGWNREVTENSIQFSTEDKATKDACLIVLFKSTPGTGNSRENFDTSWETLVKGTVNVAGAPVMQPSSNSEDWKVEIGSAPFEKERSKGSVVLVTASGYGRMISAMILTNTETYIPAITSFLDSFSFKKPVQAADARATEKSAPVAFNDGYAFATTNFDDGWNAAVKSDWVEVTKGDTKVFIHYGMTITAEMRGGMPNGYWQHVTANRYTIKNQYPTNYDLRFIQADAVEKATGENVFVSFQLIAKNGTAYCYEIVTPTRDSFSQQFPTMDKIEDLSRYNRFAIGKSDLIGTWEKGDGAFTQYYFVSSGNYAGMNITVSNFKMYFANGGSYRSEYQAVNNGVYAAEKKAGKYTVSNWDVSTTDQTSKVSNFSAWFEATKGGRILHLHNKKFTGEHYRFGKVR
jgi:hypothetical protein